jgi:hypothetical protein
MHDAPHRMPAPLFLCASETQVISHYSAKVVDIQADRPAKEVEAAIAKSLA